MKSDDQSHCRPVQEPLVTEQEKPFDGSKATHPAYALIGANRISGKAVLFGSDFVHHNSVRITIHAAEMNRSLSRDWPFARKQLIEVELSEAQWATFVSSMNIGDGVPCTLQRVAGDVIPGLPDPVPREATFRAEMAEDMQQAVGYLNDLDKAIAASGLSAKKQKELTDRVYMARMRITDSVPFVAKQFEKHMEDTTQKAMLEVNAYALAVLRGDKTPIQIAAAPAPTIQNDSEPS